MCMFILFVSAHDSAVVIFSLEITTHSKCNSAKICKTGSDGVVEATLQNCRSVHDLAFQV